MENTNAGSVCTEGCSSQSLACKLTSPELQQRKATVIASLQRLVMERQELENGFTYRFAGTDAVVDELASFIKTERLCCDFFDFSLTVKGDASAAWLTITGPQGAKEFITAELVL